MMRGSSLATRLFVSATAWLVVILTITGFRLCSVYRDATERAFDRRLNLYLRTLIAEVATPDEPADRQFQSLGEPLFELPLSGWYWQITRTDRDKSETRASRSLWDKKLPKLEEHGAELTAAGIRLGYADGPEGQNLRVVERPIDLGADGRFLVSVAGDASEIFDETRSFDFYLGGTFIALGIVLLLTTIFQVRYGLAPLKRIAARVTVVGTITEVASVIEALRRTMEKIYRDRGIAIEVKADTPAKFRGERQDLEEMVGNLIDNACKWAASQVFIEVLVEQPAEPGAGPKLLRIGVDDDGQGLSEAERT